MLDVAYRMGSQQAVEDFEKEALLSAALGVGKAIWASKPMGVAKFLTGMGGRGSQWVGAPLGMGMLGAATADPGERMKGFAGGVVGGVAGNVGWHAGSKVLKGLAGNIGKRIGATQSGANLWGNLGKVNPGYGAKRLSDYNDAVAAALKAGKKAPGAFTGDAAHSLGQHAASRWLPGAAGVAGGLGGAIYLGSAGDDWGKAMIPDIGDFTQRSAFNPVRG